MIGVSFAIIAAIVLMGFRQSMPVVTILVGALALLLYRMGRKLFRNYLEGDVSLATPDEGVFWAVQFLKVNGLAFIWMLSASAIWYTVGWALGRM